MNNVDKETLKILLWGVCSIAFLIACICTAGCRTRQPVIVDTGDIERLRSEYQQLRSEYDQLQRDYQRLTERSRFYAGYYSNATERIAAGAGELASLGVGSLAEISKLRSYVAVLRSIVEGIIAAEHGEGSADTQTDPG